MGLPALAAGALLNEQAQGGPLEPKPPHFAPKAKRVIHLFMNGGPSQVDTFDPKPALAKYAGKELPFKFKTERRTGAAFPSPFEFKQHGQSGQWISDLFPQLAAHADDLAGLHRRQLDRPGRGLRSEDHLALGNGQLTAHGFNPLGFLFTDEGP